MSLSIPRIPRSSQVERAGRARHLQEGDVAYSRCASQDHAAGVSVPGGAHLRAEPVHPRRGRVLPTGGTEDAMEPRPLRSSSYRPVGTPQACPPATRVVARTGRTAVSRAWARDMVAQEAADGSVRVGSLVKSAGQPYAGNPHVRLEEGAPVGTPWRDIQALPTERGSSSYGPSYSPTRPGPTLRAP